MKFVTLTTYIEDNDGYKADESGLLVKSHWSEIDALINLSEVLWFVRAEKAPQGKTFCQFKNGHKASIKQTIEQIEEIIAELGD